MKIGYARVSTEEQSLALQNDALKNTGCSVIYTDHGISGDNFNRPGLDQALNRLKPNDTLVVWRLDRLGRSLTKLVDLISHLDRRQIKFESITELISTDTSGGTLIFHMMAALAQFERTLISERTRAGIASARARGKTLGRKPALSKSQQRQALRLLETQSVSSVATRFDVHPRTLQRLRNAQKNATDAASEE